MPLEATTSEPPLETTVSMAVPPDSTVSVPPLLTIVPLALP
jgi:hypothetical protein